MDNGNTKSDRTGTGTISVFDRNISFNLLEGFPAVTTKKLFFNTMVTELVWLLGNHLSLPAYNKFGRTNIKYLVDHGCNIWNDWPHKNFCETQYVISMKEFINLIKTSDDFASSFGDLGPVYGKQWRDWESTKVMPDGSNVIIHTDQINDMVETIINNPDSRRNIVSAWNVGELTEMSVCGLPPCHNFFQVYSEEKDDVRYLSLKWNQRSWDVFAGGPFNIASYALLTHALAQVTNHTAKSVSVAAGDCHIYLNQMNAVHTQLNRVPYKSPTLWINPKIKCINDFQREDFKLIDYTHHEPIKAPIAV